MEREKSREVITVVMTFLPSLFSKCLLDLVVLEKTLDSPLDSKKIEPVNPKGDQS